MKQIKKHPVCFASTPLKEGNFKMKNDFIYEDIINKNQIKFNV